MSEFTHHLPHAGWAKPSRNEEEYFHRLEFRQRMELARRHEAKRAEAERARLIEIHQHHCPRCGGELEEVHVQEGHADQCPNCLGVWLDHEMFDRITHPVEDNRYLTAIFRDLLLQYGTGKLPTDEH